MELEWRRWLKRILRERERERERGGGQEARETTQHSALGERRKTTINNYESIARIAKDAT